MLFRSIQNITGELVELMKRGIYHYRFEDDNFTLRPMFEDLTDSIKGLGIRYKCHTRSDSLIRHPERAYLMKESGCEECGIGVESADNRVLRINNKKETAEQHKEAVSILKRAGIRVKTYFMAGLPGETDDTLELNKRFMAEAKPDKWTLSTFTPYPGCEIFNYPERFGITIADKNWDKWWNFAESGFNHTLNGQTQEQMWNRYKQFYNWLKEESWRQQKMFNTIHPSSPARYV